MNIFISYRGAVGWANRKIMGHYDLPPDFDLAADLVRSGFFAFLIERVSISPGVILDVKGKAACSGVPAIALFPYADRPPNISLGDSLLAYSHYLARLYDRRPRLENAVFAKTPLLGELFGPEPLDAPSILPGAVVQNSNGTNSFSLDPLAASCPVSLNFASANLGGASPTELAPDSAPLVAGLLLFFDDNSRDTDAAATLGEPQLSCGLNRDLVSPGKLVLYPEVERGQDFKWQSWLRNFLNYYDCFKRRKRKSFVSTALGNNLSKRAFKYGTENPGPQHSLLDLFRGGSSSPPALELDEINRLDEILFMREAGYLPGQFDDPAPGSILSLYRGLSEPALSPQCTCLSPAMNDNDNDWDEGVDPA